MSAMQKNRFGFTLVEMLVAIVVASILTIGMVNIFRAQHRAQNVQNTGVERTMNSRAAIDMIAREVRNAGYNPRGVANSGFVTTAASDVEWTADLNSDGDTDDTDEQVRYYLDGDAGTILRASGGATAVVADNVQGITFTYLDASLNVTAEQDEIRHVNIAVQYATPDGVMVGALETQVAIRNRIFRACAALPNILVDGDFEITGSPHLLGCGLSMHVNGDLKISGTVTAAGSVSTSGELDMPGGVENPDGDDVTVTENAPEISVPKYENPTSSHCDDADYTLTQQGKVIVEATGQELDATSTSHFGWQRKDNSPVLWEFQGNTAYPGLFCVDGSVKMPGSPGKDGASPAAMSIIAKGSIEITGAPYIKPDDGAKGFLLLAGGDVKITGEVKGANNGTGGIVYAYSNCEITNKMTAASQLMCRNMPTPGHAKELTDKNKISNSPQFTSSCTGSC